MNSQRAITMFVIIVILVAVSAYGYANGHQFVSGNDMFLTIVSAFAAVTGWYAYLNAQIAAGTVQPNDLKALLFMPSWWGLIVSQVAVAGNAVGYKILAPEQQTLIVDGITVVLGALWYSFSDRLPGEGGNSDV